MEGVGYADAEDRLEAGDGEARVWVLQQGACRLTPAQKRGRWVGCGLWGVGGKAKPYPPDGSGSTVRADSPNLT